MGILLCGRPLRTWVWQFRMLTGSFYHLSYLLGFRGIFLHALSWYKGITLYFKQQYRGLSSGELTCRAKKKKKKREEDVSFRDAKNFLDGYNHTECSAEWVMMSTLLTEHVCPVSLFCFDSFNVMAQCHNNSSPFQHTTSQTNRKSTEHIHIWLTITNVCTRFVS